ncbi:hypothetical protein MTO96_014967 [Rhipicephalus appendiculatus]
MRRESTKNFVDLVTLAAVLYVTIISSTLCSISDVVFLCSQCTGNHVCVRIFLIWNAFDIVVSFMCDVALYYLVKSVTDESYRALQVATETTSEDTTPSLDYMQDNVMERYPPGSDGSDSDYDTATDGVTTSRQPSFPSKVMAFVEKINTKPSLPQIFLVAIFKVLVLIMIKQYCDPTPPLVPDSGSSESSSASNISTSQIAAWKAAYFQRRSTLHSIQERTLAEVEASCTGEAAHTPRSATATPSAITKTATEVRLGSPSPTEYSSTQSRSCERSPSSPSLALEDKGLAGSLDADHETVKPGEREKAGGSNKSASSRPAARGQGVGSATKKPTPSHATAPQKSSAYCDVERDAKRSDISRHTVEKVPTGSEERTASTRFFITADETLSSIGASSKRACRVK